MPKIYIVPTPIGNLNDITIRALDILKSVDLILSEDTRKTSILLKHFDINAKLKSHHKFNEHKTSLDIISEILGGTKIALVSDAGTPGISDPGFFLVRECLENNIEVETLPGATAFIPALINSGLATDKFVFEGFLPQKKSRQKTIENLKNETRTIIFYESPHRIAKTLTQLAQTLGNDRKASVSRELTKIYEQTLRGTLSELAKIFTEKQTKGEIVIIVDGKPKKNKNKKNEQRKSDL